MDKHELMQKVWQHIDARKQEIMVLGDTIYRQPETGFKEFRTSKLVAGVFGRMGLTCRELADIPGVKVTIDTGRPGPGLAVIGELDAIVCSEHPDADPATGAVHACGHNAQIASLAGAAMGILDSGAAAQLSGRIHFIAVPAEEYIELSYRQELRRKGILKYLAGKPELLYRGFFDDVDMCVMVHAQSSDKKIIIESSHNGLVAKKIRYIGKASHAGSTPQDGINALYAANLGLAAINSLRETFTESGCTRVHPIMTKGGEIVNVIPSDVRLETFVRGKALEDIVRANIKVDRALAGGAIALGAGLEIEDMAGYFPTSMDKNLTQAARNIAENLVNSHEITERGHGTGSTDLGDLGTLMPVLETSIGGASGGLHSASYRMEDAAACYLLGAKLLAGLTVELLANQAVLGRQVIQEFKPLFPSKEEYFAFADRLFATKTLPTGGWQWIDAK